ncbi:MAG: hypothetical protein KAH38_06190, partial [Candidatus Hydrogenedentes bacterium]|nr:hypothetical protein [Candidatus Hydrogenedentota bacterium]
MMYRDSEQYRLLTGFALLLLAMFVIMTAGYGEECPFKAKSGGVPGVSTGGSAKQENTSADSVETTAGHGAECPFTAKSAGVPGESANGAAQQEEVTVSVEFVGTEQD